MSEPERVEVVKAIIIRSRRMLLQQRGRGTFHYRWGTPGGEVEASDFGPIPALHRKLREKCQLWPHHIERTELTFNMNVDPPLVAQPTHVRWYRVELHVVAHPVALEGVGLGWFDRVALAALPLTPADEALREALIDLLLPLEA